MQNMIKKLLFVCVFMGTFFTVFSDANNLKSALNKADESFQKKEYNKAYHLYDSLMKEEKVEDVIVWLRMSHLESMKGNTVESMYYLNKIYKTTYHEAVWMQMENLSDKAETDGVVLTDKEWVEQTYYNYQVYILLFFASITFLVFVFFIVHALRAEKVSLSRVVGLAVVLFILAAVNNLRLQSVDGIVHTEHVFMMKDASAASGHVRELKAGDRIKVLGEKEVWAKVQIGDEEGYINKHTLKKVNPKS